MLWVALHDVARAQPETPDRCPRPAPGSIVVEPRDLRSRDGVLQLDLSFRNQIEADGTVRYCYVMADGSQSPTLRLNPGDLLVLRLKNELTDPQAGAAKRVGARGGNASGVGARSGDASGAAARGRDASAPGAVVSPDPCRRSVMTITSANLHFHGLTFAPVCHQDDVLMTSIQPGDDPFEYRIRVPADEPPGLYWYHAHVHGFSTAQLRGGASGALIIEGIERANRAVAGLPERVLVVRDQDLMHPDAPPAKSEPAMGKMLVDRDGDAGNSGTGFGKPAKDLSVNFVPVPYPDYPPAAVALKPGERQLWRVVNASTVTYLNLQVLFRRVPQTLGVVAIDGVPINHGRSQDPEMRSVDHVGLPPGARVEFIVQGPPSGVRGLLVTRSVDTGKDGENDPNRALAELVATDDAPAPSSILAADPSASAAPSRPWLGSVAPARVRKLYFSERPLDPSDSNSPMTFFITEEGKDPMPFDPASRVPDIVVRQGEVEDWIIENRSAELHAFHIHQLHFEVVDWMGLPVNEPFLRDTVNIPYYSERMLRYPSVRLRMDFRDSNTIGTFVYHCHLLDHEDGGMMGRIRVEPDPASVSLVDRIGSAVNQLIARLGGESASRLADADDALLQSVCRAARYRQAARGATTPCSGMSRCVAADRTLAIRSADAISAGSRYGPANSARVAAIR